MNNITIVFPYYNNPQMLGRQIETWISYPNTHVQIIIVDDCSTESVRNVLNKHPKVNTRTDLRAIRLTNKVRWNQHACRNLGAALAKHEWLLMLDIDHICPRSTLLTLLDRPLDPCSYYNFIRENADGSSFSKGPAQNLFLMQRRIFNSIGYDEDFAGWYGGDGEMFQRAHRVVERKLMEDLHLVRYVKEDIADANTTEYERKTPVNTAALGAIWEIKQKYHIKPARLTFEWEEV